MGAPVNPSFTQTSFRFRNDDGTQTTATWAATANTNVKFKPTVILRCRFLIQQTVSTANTNLTQTFYLRYSENGGAYTDVGAQGGTTTAVTYANSANVTDGTATTQQLGAGSFVAGGIDENGAQAVTFTSGALSETEIEYVLQIYAPLTGPADTLDLRVYYGTATALNVYTNTPRLQRPRRNFVLG